MFISRTKEKGLEFCLFTMVMSIYLFVITIIISSIKL